MNAEELKALQAPIKERYRKEPQAALMTDKGLVEAGFIPRPAGAAFL
jgi:hypothetical protein